MGCCASTEEPVEEVQSVEVATVETGVTREEEVKVSLNIAESDSVKAKPGVRCDGPAVPAGGRSRARGARPARAFLPTVGAPLPPRAERNLHRFGAQSPR